MKIIIVGIILLVVLCVVICYVLCIAASDAEEWEREVHEFETKSSNENRPENK